MGMGRLDSELEDLYRRRHGAFQVMLASVTGSVESARDVVQEAFAQALRDQDGFRGEGSLEGWVWRIAFRVAIGSKGSRELAVEDVPEVAFVEAGSDPTLAAAVRQLPAQRRLAVFLRGSVLRRDRGGARNRRRNGRGDPVPGPPAAWQRAFGE
jgi:DNA-directed RNA polymerase specialized sigma24 family protein